MKPPKVAPPVLRVGQSVILQENDCLGSTSVVVIVKIHKGGNVIVQDGVWKREVGATNLSPIVK